MEDVRWSIDKMYPSREKLEADFEQIKKASEKIQDYGKDPAENVKEILNMLNQYGPILEDLVVYTNMKQDENSTEAQSQKDHQIAFQLMSDFDSALSFFRPWLLSLPAEEQQSLLEREDLIEYREYLKKILRYSAHTLDKGQEYVLSRMGFLNDAPGDIYYFLTTADMKFPPMKSQGGAKLTQQNFVLNEMDPDPAVRKEAFENLYSTFNSFGNTISTAYNNNVRALVEEAKLRNYGSARQMELFEDDVDEAVYDSLIQSVHNHMDLLQRYYVKKKELMGLKEQHMYDVYLPLLKDDQKKYSFEEAKELCLASVAPLGEEYQAIYETAFRDHWIDAFPREGKAGGAYSSGSYHSSPYILTNFNGSLDDVFTIAHEMGHSMHSYYAKKNNHFLYYNYTIFAAEVASTFNENLLLHYMEEHAETDQERLALLDHHLNSFKSTVYRQTMFAEFEKIVHERIESGQALAQADFDQIYLDLNQKYFGDSIISDPLIAHEWMRIPHFYTNFYVYQYATDYCASTVLAQGVLEGKSGARDHYFEFLKDGSHHFPIDQLKMAGVDMSKPDYVDQALDVFRQQLEKLEKRTTL